MPAKPAKTETIDWWQEERRAWAEGYRCLAGIDEAGRGALAGPVVAACVVLPFERVPSGVNDSKALTPEQRERLYAQIMDMARGVGVGLVDAPTIDRINILRAAHEAMRLALAALPPGLFPDVALIDGLPVRPFPLDQIALVKGDGRSASIAAASIIAKVTRDRLMREYGGRLPGVRLCRPQRLWRPFPSASARNTRPLPPSTAAPSALSPRAAISLLLLPLNNPGIFNLMVLPHGLRRTEVLR